MKALLLVAIVGCGGGSDGTGLVAVADVTGVSTVDVATGEVTLLDPGRFATIAIAPDKQHIVYEGTDAMPRLDDLHGHVQILPTTVSCCGAFIWSGATLSYQLATSAVQTEVVTPDGVARVIATYGIAVAHDGTRIAYQDDSGLVTEDLDGGNHAVVVPQVSINQLAFDPDDGGLTYGVFNPDNTTHLEHLVGGQRVVLGDGTFPDQIRGGSRYSPDGSEVLLIEQVGQHLVGIGLADASRHPYITDSGVGSAAYLANGRVVATTRVPVPGAVGGITITDGMTARTLQASDSSQCFISEVSLANEQLAVTCSVPAIVDFSGETLVGHDALAVLGLSPDGAGMITVDQTGVVEMVSLRTGARPIAQSLATQPIATYAP